MCERIECFNAKLVKVADVSRYDDEPMLHRCRGNHGILHQSVGTLMHQLGPYSKRCGVKRKNVAGGQYSVQPSFEFFRLGDILLSSKLNACLNLSNGDGRKVELIGGHVLNPDQDRPIGSKPPQLGNNVGIQQIHMLTAVAASDVAETVGAAASAHPCEPRQRAAYP